MAAGARNRLVAFERATMAQADSGEEVPSWAEIGREWAQAFWGRGDERRAAAMEQGQQAATFRVLANALTRSVTVRDRIVHEGVWNLVGISPDGRGLIEFIGVRAS